MGKVDWEKANISPEFQKITEAIHNWVKTNKQAVTFVGAFVTLDKTGKRILDEDDVTIGYGCRYMCQHLVDELQRQIDEAEAKEDNAFINW